MQVPQYLLEHAVASGAGAQCRVVCTQPRRVAAISVAARVAEERGEPPPGEPGSKASRGTEQGWRHPWSPCLPKVTHTEHTCTPHCCWPDQLATCVHTHHARLQVGYHVRLDAATTAATRLLFCTTGILLRRLAGDPRLRDASHVIVDEAHERTLQGERSELLLCHQSHATYAAATPAGGDSCWR